MELNDVRYTTWKPVKHSVLYSVRDSVLTSVRRVTQFSVQDSMRVPAWDSVWDAASVWDSVRFTNQLSQRIKDGIE